MGKRRQYKILYNDGSQKEVKTTDFWYFSDNDIFPQFSDGGRNLDFEYLKKKYPFNKSMIARLEQRLKSDASGTSLRKDFDNVLSALCSHSQADSDIANENYKNLRSLFGMNLINHSAYAFPLFRLKEDEKVFYSLPFNGNRRAYSDAVFNILHNIVQLRNIYIWGAIPFYLEEIEMFLCSLISPLSLIDSHAGNRCTANHITLVRIKEQKQLEQEYQFIHNIINQYDTGSLLIDFPNDYKKFRRALKNYINSYCENPKNLMFTQAQEINALFNNIGQGHELSNALNRLPTPLTSVYQTAQGYQNPHAFDVVDFIFTESFKYDFEKLYRKMFAFISWLDTYHDLIADSLNAHPEDLDSIKEDYRKNFGEYFKNYKFYFSRPPHPAIDINKEWYEYYEGF